MLFAFVPEKPLLVQKLILKLSCLLISEYQVYFHMELCWAHKKEITNKHFYLKGKQNEYNYIIL